MARHFALFVLLLAIGCGGGQPPCGPNTCSGCCDATGTCVAGGAPTACGAAGLQCSMCTAGQVCLLGSCASNSGTGGSGASGPGDATGGGSGSGTGGGSASGTGGSGGTCNETDLAFCQRLSKTCGTVQAFDRCGNSRAVWCGDCSGGLSCTMDHVCACVPTTCAAQGKNCGTLSNGCGGTLSCGSCQSPQICGASNVCGCTPTSCAAQGKNCGYIADGCGGQLNCGYCSGSQSCGGSGVQNVCGCTPTSCAAQGKNCGSISNGCGSTLNCGTCSGSQTCGGSGVQNVCGCRPTTCAAQFKNCGSMSDGCGTTLNCGTCSSDTSCGVFGDTSPATQNLCFKRGYRVNSTAKQYAFAYYAPGYHGPLSTQPCITGPTWFTCSSSRFYGVPSTSYGYCNPMNPNGLLDTVYSEYYCGN